MFLQYLQETKTDIEEHIDQHFPVDESKYDTAHYGTIDFHEQIIFDHKPYLKSTVLYLKEYMEFWITMSRISAIPNETAEEGGTNTKARLIMTLDNKQVFSSEQEDAFIDALACKLPFAHSIKIDNTVSGKLLHYMTFPDSPVADSRVSWLELISKQDASLWTDYGLWGKVRELKRRELFTYKQILQYTNPFGFAVHHINKGRELTAKDIFTEDFLEIQEGHLWTNEWITLSIDFDFDEHPVIVEAIQNAVRGFLHGYELSYLEDEWKHEEYQMIFAGTCLFQINIIELQKMLEKINQALLPVIGNCSADTEEAWLYDYEGFGIAKILWSDEGFFIAGGIM